ncbi:hypothetical protein PIROE2DRAFT_16472 [Piromyces sp. E2]|nr:hypothetical protein PIROE2DRAFT_16472 [Piromyces sp. E2]|eukprot:OUM58288.1 hypothetical protein PIROE2DRAFT_16472 [Piromyces sp. E2]
MEQINSSMPLLAVPMKLTDKVDFFEELERYFNNINQNDIGNKNEIKKFNRLRQDIRDAGRDIIGRNIVYKYYGQLKYLEQYLKSCKNSNVIEKNNNEINISFKFKWYDAFTGEGGEGPINYEKACVIFNLAALISNMAVGQDMKNIEGKKTACKYYQVSAGFFKYINDNFQKDQQNFPTLDIKKESITCLNKLMLASAQECLLKIEMSNNISYDNLYKIASYLSYTYEKIYEMITEKFNFKYHFNLWKPIFILKSKYYAFISYYYKALISDDEAKYGYVVSYLVLAEKNILDMCKLTKKALNSNDRSLKYNKSILQNLLTIGDSCSNIISTMKKQAVKDNDEIYNEIIPDIQLIKELERECFVRNLNFDAICQNGQKEIQHIIGHKVFRDSIHHDVIHVQ